MQACKKRAVEEVRYRSTTTYGKDGNMTVVVVGMRQALREYLKAGENESQPLTGGIVDLCEVTLRQEEPQEFLKRMSSRSLVVTKLRQETEEGAVLRERYATLLNKMPESTMEKFDVRHFSKLEAAKAVTSLVTKHSGEVVGSSARNVRGRFRI